MGEQSRIYVWPDAKVLSIDRMLLCPIKCIKMFDNMKDFATSIAFGTFKKLRNVTIGFVVSVCPSVRPSPWNNSAPLEGFYGI